MKRQRRSYILLFTLFLLFAVTAFAHPGSLDENGGHYNRKTGEYHYHSGENTQYNPSNSSDYSYSYEYETTSETPKETSVGEVLLFIFMLFPISAIIFLTANGCCLHFLFDAVFYGFKAIDSLKHLGFVKFGQYLLMLLKIILTILFSLVIIVCIIIYVVQDLSPFDNFESIGILVSYSLSFIVALVMAIHDISKDNYQNLNNYIRNRKKHINGKYNGGRPRTSNDVMVLKILDVDYPSAYDILLEDTKTFKVVSIIQNNKKKAIIIATTTIVLIGAAVGGGFGIRYYIEKHERYQVVEDAMISEARLMIQNTDNYLNMLKNYDETKTYHTNRTEAFLHSYNRIIDPVGYPKEMYQYVLVLSTAINNDDLDDILEARNDLAEHIDY